MGANSPKVTFYGPLGSQKTQTAVYCVTLGMGVGGRVGRMPLGGGSAAQALSFACYPNGHSVFFVSSLTLWWPLSLLHQFYPGFLGFLGAF